MLSCREFDEFMDDYMERKLGLRARISMFMHHLFCSSCRRYMKDYIEAKEMGGTLFDDLDSQVPENVPQELIDTVLKSRQSDQE